MPRNKENFEYFLINLSTLYFLFFSIREPTKRDVFQAVWEGKNKHTKIISELLNQQHTIIFVYQEK